MSIITLSRNPLKHTHKMSLLRHELHSVFFPHRYIILNINIIQKSALGKHFIHCDVANYTI